MTLPRLLILSFDPIDVDPRIMKQIRRFVTTYQITTCGPGPSPHPEVEHIELDPTFVPTRGRVMSLVDEVARKYERFGWLYRNLPMPVLIRQKLAGRIFDVAIANDANTVGIASEIVGADRVLADLHEFFPGLPQPDSNLGLRQTRWWTWLVRAHCAKAGAATTVGSMIAERYLEFGVTAGVVANASPRKDLAAHPTSQPIRLVHSGNPFRDRGLGAIMQAVARTKTDVTLDLYLMQQNQLELSEVVSLAEALGPRITVHDPVSQSELVETLNTYDIGIHVLPPTSINNALALPNKFFDFVQARLGVIVGPSPEMASIVQKHNLGWVTESFEEDAIVAVLDSLTPELVDKHKRAADAASEQLSAEEQNETWAAALEGLLTKKGIAG